MTGRVFVGRDLLGYHLPIEKVVHDAWARGRLPVWVSEISGGRPLAANPNVGALYPVRAMVAGLPFPLAMSVYPVLHWSLAGLGAMCLARAMGLSLLASWVAAVTYAFSGVGLTDYTYTNLQPGLALLPWVVWSSARRDPRQARKGAILALFLALDLYAGDVFSVGLALAGAFLWPLLEERGASRRAGILAAGLGAVLALLLAAPQILAALLWAPLTNRAVLGMNLDEVVSMSLSPFRILELVVPYPFGRTWEPSASTVWATSPFNGRIAGFFGTIYAGALGAIAVAAAWRRREPGARFVRAFLILGAALAIPPSVLPKSWGALPSPLPLRYPEKFALAIVLALALLSALFLERWRAKPWKLRGPFAIGILLTILAAGAAWRPDAAGRLAIRMVGAADVGLPVVRRMLPTALAEAGLLWVATLIGLELLRAGSRARAAVALVLLTAVPLAANRRIARTSTQDDVLAPPPFVRWVARRDPEGVFRSISYDLDQSLERALQGADPDRIAYYRRNWTWYTPALWGRGSVFNGDPDHGDLSRAESARRLSGLASRYRDAGAFFGSVSLRFAERQRARAAMPGFHRTGGDGVEDWDEHERPFPDVRLLERWRETSDPKEALSAVPRLDHGEVAIESGRSAAGAARPGRLAWVERSPERFVCDVATPDPTWLFALRGWWPYRSVAIDGRRLEAVPAQLAFSAVPVPAGAHRVEWREELPGSGVSAWGPVLALLIAAGLIVREGR